MKKRAAVLILLLAGRLGASAEPLADTVSTLRLPGRGQYGQCTVFAAALSDWLRAQGQSSEIIYYAYKAGLVRHSQAHAIVAWERAGRLWVLGNEGSTPRPLTGEAEQESIALAQQYDSRAFIASRGGQKSAAPPRLRTNVPRPPVPPPIPPAPGRLAPPAAPPASSSPAPRAAPAPRFYTDKNGTQFLIEP